jgi:hypothetical protein
MMKQVLLATAQQFTVLLGWLFVMGLLLHLLARAAQYLYMRALGPTAATWLTGWLGTPVHELGHAVFCPIFGHKIRKIRLWAPFSEDGTSGSVEHAWNRKNLYQNIGNLFIAAGPILLGSALILIGFFLLVPGKGAALGAIRSCTASSWGLIPGPDCLPGLLSLLFFPGSLQNPFFWIFLYGSFCIASHMGLSFQDLKGCLWGAAVLVVVLLVINTAVHMAHLPAFNTYLFRFASAFRETAGILVFAVLLSAANLLFAFCLFTAKRLSGFLGRR